MRIEDPSFSNWATQPKLSWQNLRSREDSHHGWRSVTHGAESTVLGTLGILTDTEEGGFQ